MPRRINKVQLVLMTIIRVIVKRDALGFDGNTALTLNIHGVQHLGGHVTLFQTTADLNKSISQRRLAMINMGNDRKISNVLRLGQLCTTALYAASKTKR